MARVGRSIRPDARLELPTAAKNILCLGAHADDIEIGCGGTLLKWIGERRGLTIHWVVFTAEGKRAQEAHSAPRRFCKR